MNDNNDFYVYVLPVSGGALVSHLSLLREIYDARIKSNGGISSGSKSYAPDLVLGSSGGNICAYIGLMSDWNSSLIEKNVDIINSNLFIKNWVNDDFHLIPSLPFSFLNKSLYNQGIGAKSIFNKTFTIHSIQRVEIWSGTFDSTNKKAQFFCNKSSEDTYITETFFNEEQYHYSSMPLIYLNGCIDNISEICVASCTIPTIVPSKVINGIKYDDGGVMYASPLSVFSREIYRIVTGKEEYRFSKKENKCIDPDIKEFTYIETTKSTVKNLRLIYFYPYQPNNMESSNFFIKLYLDSMLNVAMNQDRNSSIELLNKLCNGNVKSEDILSLNSTILGDKLKVLNKRKHYIICLYPHGNPSVDITKLNGEAILKSMDEIKESYGCQIWFSEEFI